MTDLRALANELFHANSPLPCVRQLQRAKRAFERFDGLRVSARGKKGADYAEVEDALWSFFQNCWHVKDWSLNDPVLPHAVRAMIEDAAHADPTIRLIRALANGSKHLSIETPSKKAVAKDRGIILDDLPGGLTALDFAIESQNGTVQRASEIATRGLQRWRDIFDQLGIGVRGLRPDSTAARAAMSEMMRYQPLDRVAASMYLSEIRNLTDSLLYRFDLLVKAQEAWLAHSKIATAQAAGPIDEWSPETFSAALNVTTTQQTEIFDLFESISAAWARLSLLVYPIGGRGEVAAWREKRGEILRAAVKVAEGSLLADRAFRDSWMHFDERLDAAVLDGTLGNRQRFCVTAEVASAIKHTVRVVDVQALEYHFRDRDGVPRSVAAAAMRAAVDAVNSSLADAGATIATELPERPK